MEEITSPTSEPVPPELAAIDAYLTNALRVPPLDTEAVQVMAQSIMCRGESAGRAGTEKSATRISRREWVGLGARTQRSIPWLAGVVATILIAVVLVRPATPPRTETTTTYATGVGKQATVTLSDGTQLTLAPQTTLRLTGFGTHTRTVDLDGEAYIEVTHAAGAPFIVHSNGVRAQVLGTAFLMRHYRGERSVHVAVAEGKVRVQSGAVSDRAVTLMMGHIADVSDSTITTMTIDESVPDADWAGGKLRFHNTPLPQVLATLSRWYGYEFRLTDSTLAQSHVTLVLSTRSSTTMLAVLEQLLRVNLAVVGDTVTITPRVLRQPSGSPRLRNYDVWTPTREVGR